MSSTQLLSPGNRYESWKCVLAALILPQTRSGADPLSGTVIARPGGGEACSLLCIYHHLQTLNVQHTPRVVRWLKTFPYFFFLTSEMDILIFNAFLWKIQNFTKYTKFSLYKTSRRTYYIRKPRYHCKRKRLTKKSSPQSSGTGVLALAKKASLFSAAFETDQA